MEEEAVNFASAVFQPTLWSGTAEIIAETFQMSLSGVEHFE